MTLASRGNSASEKLQRETQRLNCCLYKTPYITAPVREPGDVIARTQLYAQLPTDAPTRTIFGSRVTVFSRDPSCWSIGSYVPFLRGSHMQKQYRKRTTLCSESSTCKGLLYALDPEKREKGMLSDQPQLSRITPTALLCHWGRSRSKIWCPSGLTLRRMPYGRGMLRIPLQRIS